MGRRSNGLSEEWVSEKWAVGIMGCRNYDLTPVFSTNKTDRYIVEMGVKHHKPSSLTT
jgi:hypothetical protein